MAKGTITPSAITVNNIQGLPDLVVGQASNLKLLFDKSDADQQDYINDTLIPELNGDDGSKKIGHSSLNISADNVNEAIEEVRDIAIQAQAGTIIDGSIEDVKLSNSPTAIKQRFSNFSTQYEYQTPTVVSQEIQVSKPSDSAIIKFKLSASVSGGAITISTDGGSTSLPLVEEDGTTAVTSLDIGIYEVVYATSFFILKSKGAKEAIYGKRDGTEITLVDSKGVDVKIKENEYIYMNENTQLVLDNPTVNVYDRTTPVQVVNSAYDTSGNGGRKLVRLSDGNLIAIARNSTTDFRLYKSTNFGVSFTLIKIEIGSFNDVAIATDGTNILVITSLGTGICRFFKYDENGTQIGSFVDVDSSQTAMGNVSLTIDSNGHLHAAWSSKNATYPNSFNIRYSKSTDGGVTWASPTQKTTYNNSIEQVTNPSIICDINNLPVILCKQTSGTTYQIYAILNDNSKKYLISVATYTQYNPSATVDSNGVIHVVWEGKDATSNNQENIYYSYSSNYGVTWNTAEKLTDGTTQSRKFGSITTNKSNEIFIAYRYAVTGGAELRYLLKSSGSWVNSDKIDDVVGGYPSTLVSKDIDFEKPVMIYGYGISPTPASVKFYGKWTESNSPQIIPSLATATAESELQAIGDGVLKSLGSTDKFYVGYHSKVSNGFTPL